MCIDVDADARAFATGGGGGGARDRASCLRGVEGALEGGLARVGHGC